MDQARALSLGPSAGRRSLSRASTASKTLVPTPPLSETSDADTGPRHIPMPAAVPVGPLLVRTLSTKSWRPQYPYTGQFAMSTSEEVVAAGPDGLFYFMRVRDHPSKPWSQPRPFPPTTARLNSSTVTGLSLQYDLENPGKLHVYCVAGGVLHAFSRSKDPSSSFVVDPSPPFAGSQVSGTPAVAALEGSCNRNWCVVAPCQSGGILFTSTGPPQRSSYHAPPEQGWEPAYQVAAQMGIISAVSVVVTHPDLSGFGSYCNKEPKDIVTACIASGRLHSIEWPFEKPSTCSKKSWQSPKCIRVQHPGEVTGNPVLLKGKKDRQSGYSLDLLVPSAEGGIFHFMRSPESPDEWHMIGRIGFPPGVPMASSLACLRVDLKNDFVPIELRAHVQCGGRLYLIKTSEGAYPWAGSQLYPIKGPGPYPH